MNSNLLFAGAFVFSTIFSLLFIFKVNSSKTSQQQLPRRNDSGLYNTELAEKLFDEVRILCLVMTYSENHQTHALHVKNTWGQQCNKLVFISDKHDAELGAVALPSSEGREFLWGKTKQGFQYAYKHYFDDADWFVKADDDNYMMIENLRYMLYQYHHQTSLYIGHRFAVVNLDEGYMAGGGYVLSKGALEKFVTKILPDASQTSRCKNGESGSEDFEMGACLNHNAILVDERDGRKQKRFFPLGFESDHLKKRADPNWWYDQSQYYKTALGTLDCCSDLPIDFHYVGPMEMYMIPYLTRNVHPFGLEKNSTEELPRKLKFEEILSASDAKSDSVNYRQHPLYHNLDPREKLK